MEHREDRDREKRDKRELRFEEKEEEYQYLLLLVVQLPQGIAFLPSSSLDSAVKRCSEVFVSRSWLWSGPNRLVKYLSGE